MSVAQDLAPALGWLDRTLEREIMRLRGRYQLSLDEYRGLYVSDAQVDALLSRSGIDLAEAAEDLPISIGPRWAELAGRLGLGPLECAIAFLAFAPELDTRYPTLYAYLNDDVARRRPTLDLALRLLAGSAATRNVVRTALAPDGLLATSGLLTIDRDPSSGLLAAYSLTPAAAHHLLGGDALALAGFTTLAGLVDGAPGAADLAHVLAEMSLPPVVVLHGQAGTGRRDFAAAVASCCGKRLALCDVTTAGNQQLGAAVTAALIEGAVLAVVVGGAPDPQVVATIEAAPCQILVLAASAPAWERALATRGTVSRNFEIGPIEARRKQWRTARGRAGVRASAAAIDAVADRFRLSAGAIDHAVRQVRLATLTAPDRPGRASAAQLLTAARAQCAIDLGHLAAPIATRPGWDDLVVPGGVLEQLKDFAAAGTQRDRVYGDWGMGRVGRGVGGGVAALFTGASGTGKTLSAAVIAKAMGLDLWRIDLSSVVSKYIGETEKNLEKIFTAAQNGDAILFFDEADALFGKRSEVKDAHDRYANIEVSYLLQKLEEYDGISILASNYSRNIDQAFVRRLQYIVEFPLPDERLRQRLWRKAFAPATPLLPGIDYAYLGNTFAMSGGDIRSSALDAAFLAAATGEAIGMHHIVRAVSRQLLKQGHLPDLADFATWPVEGRALLEAAE